MGLTDADIILEIEGVKEVVKTVAVNMMVVMDLQRNTATTVARRGILRERVGRLEEERRELPDHVEKRGPLVVTSCCR